MNITQLAKELASLGYPIAYLHFKKSETNPPPAPPFIVYLESDSDNIGADNKVWKKVKNYEIELYTDKKDLTIEKKIEDLLDTHSIFYDTSDVFISEENLLQRIYYIQLID